MKRILLTSVMVATLLLSACGAPVATPSPMLTPTPTLPPMPAPTAISTPTPTSTPTPSPTPAPKATPTAEAATLKEWRGSGIKITEPFTVAKTPWAVAWDFKRGEYGGILVIYVYRPGGSLPVAVVANTMKDGKGDSYVYETGTFYLNISNSTGDWTVAVVGQR